MCVCVRVPWRASVNEGLDVCTRVRSEKDRVAATCTVPASVGQAGAVSASLEPRSSSPRFFSRRLGENIGE